MSFWKCAPSRHPPRKSEDGFVHDDFVQSPGVPKVAEASASTESWGQKQKQPQCALSQTGWVRIPAPPPTRGVTSGRDGTALCLSLPSITV